MDSPFGFSLSTVYHLRLLLRHLPAATMRASAGMIINAMQIGCDQDDRHSEKGDDGSRSGGNLFRHIFCQVGANDTQDIGDQDVPCQQTGILCHICKIIDGYTEAEKVNNPFDQVSKQ